MGDAIVGAGGPEPPRPPLQPVAPRPVALRKTFLGAPKPLAVPPRAAAVPQVSSAPAPPPAAPVAPPRQQVQQYAPAPRAVVAAPAPRPLRSGDALGVCAHSAVAAAQLMFSPPYPAASEILSLFSRQPEYATLPPPAPLPPSTQCDLTDLHFPLTEEDFCTPIAPASPVPALWQDLTLPLYSEWDDVTDGGVNEGGVVDGGGMGIGGDADAGTRSQGDGWGAAIRALRNKGTSSDVRMLGGGAPRASFKPPTVTAPFLRPVATRAIAPVAGSKGGLNTSLTFPSAEMVGVGAPKPTCP